MRFVVITAFCAFSTFALAQSTPAGGNSNAPTTRPHGTSTARPMTPMERIAELERRVAELERLVAQLTGTTSPGDASSAATQPTAVEPAKGSIFDTPSPQNPPKETPKAATPPKPATPAASATPAAGDDWTSRIHAGDTKEAFDKEFADWKSELVMKYSNASQKTYRYTNPKTAQKFLASFKRSNNKLDSWNMEQ